MIKKLGVLLSATPREFESNGVLNPAVIKIGNRIHLFYRAVSNNNISTIGYCQLASPTKILQRSGSPILIPESSYESHGIEDPRIVRIGGIFYLTYTAYNGINALGAMATSQDLKHWKKSGIIAPTITLDEFRNWACEGYGNLQDLVFIENQDIQGLPPEQKRFIWDKNLILFPRKINSQYYFLHRIKPDIQIVSTHFHPAQIPPEFWRNYFNDFNYHQLIKPRYNHESSYVGGGCPPIETPDGWLLIYHAAYYSQNGYVYSACAALLDLNNPKIEIARLPYPLFSPDKDWEMNGVVNNVCFPTGAIVENHLLYIFYGAADTCIAVAEVKMPALLSELQKHKTPTH